MQALLSAEQQGITANNATEFTTTTVFGDEFKNMFVDTIAAVGNYGEMYDRHLEGIISRRGLNLINKDESSGLIYSHPFGNVQNDGPGPINSGTLEMVSQQGHL